MALATAPAARRSEARPTVGLFAIFCALFFASGACGLVYQQLWLRQLSLVFGVTVYAVSTVLASFFGGLALGSFLAGRWSRRTRRPLQWYGLAEVLVGALALVTPAALRGVERLYVAIADGLPHSVPLLTAVRLVLSFAVLIVPATLLGATLPLVSGSRAVRGSRAGERIGLLYATNTAGAITGTLVTGFWMIGSLGVGASFRVAAAVNVAVGVVAIAAARRSELPRSLGEKFSLAEQIPKTSEFVQRLPARAARAVLAVFAVSGFVSIALEVVWFRVLVLYVESDTYAFTIMLAAVLGGIATGSYVAAAMMHRWGARLVHLVVLEVAVAVAALTSFAFLAKAYTVNGRFGEPLGAFGQDVRFVIVAGALTVAPTALLLGIAFPIGVALWTGTEPDTAGRVGTFYAVNVAAGIAGSLAAGFVLIPLLGTEATLVVLAAALLAVAVVLVGAVRPPPRTSVGVVGAGALVFVVLAFAAVPDPYRAALTYRYPGQRLLWQDEGPQTTVSIHEVADGKRVMYLNNLHQTNTSAAMVSFHRAIGALPLALHPDPQQALVVGLGGGVTPGALSDDPGLQVDVVELSSEVVDGAEWLSTVNGDVTHRENVDIRVDDGRNFLLTTDRRYDIITADVIQPRTAGAGKLWSVEYWELTRDALAPGGIMVQWVPAGRARDHALIVRSFVDVFPYITVWSGGELLVGSNGPIAIDATAYARRLAEPGVGDALAAAGLGSVDQLAAAYLGGRDELVAYAGDGPLLTDDRPRLEFWKSGGSDADRPPDLSGLDGDPADVISV